MKNFKFVLLILLMAFLLTACDFNKNTDTSIEKPISNTGAEMAEEADLEELAPEEVIPQVKEAELAVVGDLMVHQWQLDDAYNKETGRYDFNYCFEHVKKYFDGKDLVIGNLETVIAEDLPLSDYPCFNSPVEFVDALKNAGFNLLTTANNHSMDKKVEGVLNTLKVLDEREISHFGTYSSAEERDGILVKDVNGIKLAFVSATYGTNGIPLPQDKPYLVNILSEELITEDIKRAKSLNPDFVIVMPHLGNEYESYPRDVFINWIDIMIKAGADIVLASHPHVLQPMEFRTVTTDSGEERTAFVTYSLANFISSQRDVPRDTGVIVNLKFSKVDDNPAEIEQVSYIPTWVQWRDTSNNYNIRVLPIYDALKENNFDLRQQDINRLTKALSESNKTISNCDINIDNMQEMYYIKE